MFPHIYQALYGADLYYVLQSLECLSKMGETKITIFDFHYDSHQADFGTEFKEIANSVA